MTHEAIQVKHKANPDDIQKSEITFLSYSVYELDRERNDQLIS